MIAYSVAAIIYIIFVCFI